MDGWDIVGGVGIAAVLTGVAAIYWPLALVLFGGVLLAAYYLGERGVK